jgi:hypothetical protein
VIREFERRPGVGAVLNTSLNLSHVRIRGLAGSKIGPRCHQSSTAAQRGRRLGPSGTTSRGRAAGASIRSVWYT